MENEKLQRNCFKFTEKILYNYKEMESNIESMECLKKEIKAENSIAIRAITYDDVKVSPTYKISNAVRDGVIDPVKVVQEIEIDIYHETSLKKKLDKAINNLNHIRKQIVELRYVKEMGWTEMAQELYHDEKTLRKYKNEAVKSIAVELFGSKVFKEEDPTLFDLLII
jgi:DNA-directed RNA polymerase specialized sigma subunit